MLNRLREEISGEFSPLLSVSIFVAFVAYYMDGSFDFSNAFKTLFSIIGFIGLIFIVFCLLCGIYTSVNSEGKRNVLNAIKVGGIASFVAFVFFKIVGW